MPATVSKAEVPAPPRAARGGDLRAARCRVRSYRVTCGGRASSAWAWVSVSGGSVGGTGGGYAPTMRSAPPAPVREGPGQVVGARGGMVRRSGGRAGAAPGGERGTTGRGQSNAAEHVGQRAAALCGRAAVPSGDGAGGHDRRLGLLVRRDLVDRAAVGGAVVAFGDVLGSGGGGGGGGRDHRDHRGPGGGGGRGCPRPAARRPTAGRGCPGPAARRSTTGR